MYLPLGTYSPDIKLALVSASRSCFPRSLSESRTKQLKAAVEALGIDVFIPEGECQIIENKDHARDAAQQAQAAGCDAVVLYLGNFSPEIEDAYFIKQFNGPAMVMAAAEESASTLGGGRGDALCGLMSCAMAIEKRGMKTTVHMPENPIVTAETGAEAIADFIKIAKVVKGTQNATVGLFGPRPRDFETCNYNVRALMSMGVEVEEFGFFDLSHEVERIKAEEDVSGILAEMNAEMANIPQGEFAQRLAAYEMAILNWREKLQLSGLTSQCWSEQEETLKHVPCYINARMASKGFPVACENDVQSLIAELMAQYASDNMVAILDINHSIPSDLDASLADVDVSDCVGMFHCGNTAPARVKNPEMKYQVIMKSLMEPDTEADITRGTIEGQIAASPITVVQVHGVGDKMRAYIIEGEFLDLDPMTFGCTGTAYLPGFQRFYRHVLLGRFHHHAAIAFEHCGGVLYDALKMMGVEEIYTPNPDCVPYAGENTFRK
jgi:L-fucose isomerase-like protein